MKHFFSLLLIVLAFSYSQAQNDSIKVLTFKVNFPADSSSIDDIDFTKEKPECEFELKGEIPLKYSFRLQNDSIASLYQLKNNEFQFQENMSYQPFPWNFDNDLLISNFKIIDFDNDGDEDLLCWVFSNVNTNEWTIIFINDQTQQKLVRLYNTADDTDIWNRPEFDKETSTINTELYGSAYGRSEESSYLLKTDLTIIPIKKHFQHRTGKHMIDYEYIGKNGKWKLKSKNKVKAEKD
ncbi:hypothetical protein NJT12_00450 [Flavobacterium sp. AC]|uniref:VCBS repeat-containing protein n=1 Tax=Flavobacterium azizsancarii TaxID=2961580 RepID=A0ABT4W651_9FLAO|nr:hypothetical protein [Flavobacterium azizsancarii]MDA6068073.1 hypothetical protein [Flavobacterium azizsancarii]